MNQERFTEFFRVYEEELAKAVANHPGDYRWPVSEVPNVVGRMKTAVTDGRFNKDSHAFKGTCKRLGLKYTYKAIGEHLDGAWKA